MHVCVDTHARIDFTSNSLVDCSNSFEHLSKLKRLIIDRNALCDIQFKGLASLVTLSLADNRLNYLNDMGDLRKLVNLNLSGNKLTGTRLPPTAAAATAAPHRGPVCVSVCLHACVRAFSRFTFSSFSLRCTAGRPVQPASIKSPSARRCECSTWGATTSTSRCRSSGAAFASSRPSPNSTGYRLRAMPASSRSPTSGKLPLPLPHSLPNDLV